jgi:hypothetical protein
LQTSIPLTPIGGFFGGGDDNISSACGVFFLLLCLPRFGALTPSPLLFLSSFVVARDGDVVFVLLLLLSMLVFKFSYGNGIAATFAVGFVGCSLCFGSIYKFSAVFDSDFCVDSGLLFFAKAPV